MNLALSVMVATALALVIGAVVLARRRGPDKQVWLMLVLAVVLIANVAIWTVPDAAGSAPLGSAAGRAP